MNYFLYFFVGFAYASDGLRNDGDGKPLVLQQFSKDSSNQSDGGFQHSDAIEPVGTSEQTASGVESVSCDDESDVCAICYDACQHRSSSALLACGSCGSKFHLGCLKTSLLSKCPICRQQMDKDINAILGVIDPQKQIDALETISQEHISLSSQTKRFSSAFLIIELFVEIFLSQYWAISTESRLRCLMTVLILQTWVVSWSSSIHENMSDRVKAECDSAA